MKKAIMFTALLAVTSISLAQEIDKVVNGVYWAQEKAGRQVLLDNKYHDIQILNIQPRHCDGKLDPNSVGFRAISPDNHIVTGTVCGGKVIPKMATATEVI